MDLHIGVTTSTGAIVEFDRCGLRRQNQQNLEHNPTDDTTTKLTPQSTLHQSLMMKNSNAIRSCTSGGDGTNVVGVTTTAGKPRNLDTGYSKWNQSLLVEQVPEEWCEHWDTVLEEVSITNMQNTSGFSRARLFDLLNLMEHANCIFELGILSYCQLVPARYQCFAICLF